MEIALSFAIINKAGGLYGALSLLTGHKMNFWQWVYNLFSFITLPFYLLALFSIQDKASNVRKTCLGCSVYLIDTIFGVFYTVYFVYFWFTSEDHSPSKSPDLGLATRAVENLSQSASPQRELFLTVSGVLITTALRFYFSCIFLAFARALVRQAQADQRNFGVHSIGEEVGELSGVVGRIRRFVYALEHRAKHFFIEHLA